MPLPVPPNERLFPTLTAAQVARVAVHGRRRAVERGEVLVAAGSHAVPFFVVVSGELRASDAAETLIVAHQPGQFTGEANMLTGRRSIAQLRVAESGEVIELAR
jgi:thioredoxin reductase (NADPH)